MIVKGSFARVWTAENLKNKKYLAVKIFKKTDLIKFRQVDHMITQIKIQTILNHNFIVNNQIRQLYFI